MKTNKLKAMAVCCLISTLWLDAKCAEDTVYAIKNESGRVLSFLNDSIIMDQHLNFAKNQLWTVEKEDGKITNQGTQHIIQGLIFHDKGKDYEENDSYKIDNLNVGGESEFWSLVRKK